MKKLYPGGAWKGPNKFWSMKTAEESFLAMVTKLALAQEMKPPGMRSAMQQSAIQDVAHQCAFLVKVIDEVAGQHTVPRQTLIDGLLTPFVDRVRLQARDGGANRAAAEERRLPG